MVPRILTAHTAQANCGSSDGLAFSVKIRHDDFEAAVLFMQEVFDGDGDVVECDECASRGANAGVVHLSGCYANGFQGDNEEGYSTCSRAAGTDCCCDIVSPDGVGDPFLGSVHNVVVALANSSRFDVRHIGASCSLSDSDTQENSSTYHLAL